MELILFHNLSRKVEGVNSLSSSCDSGIENKPVGAHENNAFHEITFEAEDGKKNELGVMDVKDNTEVSIEDVKQRDRVPSIWRSLARCFGSTFLFAAVMKLFHDALLFVSPYLLQYVFRFFQNILAIATEYNL